jgi:retinol dehydrogenase 12
VLSGLAGRTIVITGATSGVGRALAHALARQGARVVVASRDPERTRAVRDAIRAEGGDAAALELDLADFASVRRAAREVGDGPIDTLVNNAAVAGARGRTRDGFELAFGTNHLGHYLLTRLLLERITRRIVHVGSGSHASVRTIPWETCTKATRSRTGIHEYAVSKLAVALFHHELSRLLERRTLAQQGTCISVMADPGNVATDAYRHLPCPLRQLWTCRMPPPEHGARTPELCVVGPVEPGAAYANGRVFVTSEPSRSAELGRELWARSARWVELPESLS